MQRVLTVVLALASLLCVGAVPASAEVSYVRVTPDNFKSVFPDGTVRPISSREFVAGPARPPLGSGSLQLQTVDSNGKQQHLTRRHAGTPLAAIRHMGYSTYRHAFSVTSHPEQVVAINMEIFTNPGQPNCTTSPVPGVAETCNRYTTLVFEPIYNKGQGPVTPGVWQHWDAYDDGKAIWWSSKEIAGVETPFGQFEPWAAIVAANPNAVVLTYGPNQGGGNEGLTSNVDALHIGTRSRGAVYDFEPRRGRGRGDDDGGGHGKRD